MTLRRLAFSILRGGSCINKLRSVTSPIRDVVDYLEAHGPTRSSSIAGAFMDAGAAAATARKRLSRSRERVHRFPIPLLPKREDFLYLPDQRNTEQFWENFVRDLRATGSVYAAAIDGVAARGGVVLAEEFDVVSGAPSLPTRKHLTSTSVASHLAKAGFMKQRLDGTGGVYYELDPKLAPVITAADLNARRLAEGVILDGLRDWTRFNSFAAFGSVAVRGESGLKPIGPFAFDLAGPSYLLPLRHSKAPGFFVSDVFSDGTLNRNQIQYFIRKCQTLKALRKDIGVLGMLVAPGFTGDALTDGHAQGILLTTPGRLFGPRVGAALESLVETLKRAAAYASSSPERLVSLINDLADIEGSAGNLRGILFELIAAYLVRRSAVSIDLGIRAKDLKTGKQADIDIQGVEAQSSAVRLIECKAKAPGGTVTADEVQEWIDKLPTFHAHYRQHPSLREAKLTCELWTTGTFEEEALELLRKEKRARVNRPIDWKDGSAVLILAATGKEKAISDALYQHFLKHPLARVSTGENAHGLPRPEAFPREVAPYLDYVAFPPGPKKESA